MSIRRASAVLLSALYLVGLFVGPLHTLLEEHVRCAEHGQLVHKGDHEAERAIAAPAARLPLLLAATAHADHEHCGSCTLAPESLEFELVRTLEGAQTGDGESSEPVRVAALQPTSPRYLLAPKQSPPV